MPPTLRLYNTLTRTKEVFTPVDPQNVRMYVCGPTVYDYAHIGNARPVIVFDVLYRLLRHLYGQDHVRYARNLTDVDDKINARAARDFPGLPLNQAIARVTQATTAQFHKDVAALGNLPPDEEPRATGHIEEMQAIIHRLIARGVAYVEQEHVLFHVPAVAGLKNAPKYGSLARRSLDEMVAGARVDVAPYKRDPMDFVLWKPSRDGLDPGWTWPAGAPEGITVPGRPGWHIECSAMSMAKLLTPFGGGLACDDPAKNLFDIHGGGIDLVFPHHENELAQSCCAFGGAEGAPRMANIWMHNGFLQVEGEKMSKSLGNFVTINELLETEKFGGRRWPGEVLRLAMLKTHYRQPIDWTVKALEEAEKTLGTLRNFAAGRAVRGKGVGVMREVMDHLADDLNTPAALNYLEELAGRKHPSDAERDAVHRTLGLLGFTRSNTIYARLDSELERAINALSKLSGNNIRAMVEAATYAPSYARTKKLKPEVTTLAKIQAIAEFGQHLAAKSRISKSGEYGHVLDRIRARLPVDTNDEEKAIENLIAARLEARRAKNFAESDRIRDELAAMGIALKDGKDPATGEPVTSWEVKR